MTNDEKLFLWVNRIIRWGIGLSLIWFGGGLEGKWPALLFGGIFILSGFFRPRGCMGGQCNR
ncbi:hypothetical protein [Chitinophaga sp. XS-30]|uniref:hypothetical protein n=1 Tax=Chitinophaga sp. XS-30 TaxID=2604421 RepID=UPI0011DDA393|nr:hypothetical protein [Chitinophaga sp. XS-30]QEH43010.1 hypothetical protein FW415_19905 [Chitinophaga sp. XS-30]